jgi:23S rRNA (cytosine1962-C5)-methyltransferase
MINKFAWVEPSLLRAFHDEGTNAHRLCTADDGWVERLGRDILISYRNDATRDRMIYELHLWAKTSAFQFSRIFGRFLPRQQEGREPPRLLLGDPGGSLEEVVTERKLKFGIDFDAGYSIGLFLDQRENRAYVRKIAPPKLLNCFAYTCSFSIAAAAADAETVNVDLSRKSLTRGRQNFGLNNFPADNHRFIVDDVRPVLRRLAARHEKFDMIILDPPTFSRAPRGHAFRVETDFEDLIVDALSLIDRAGRILLSTNCATLPEPSLRAMARRSLKKSRRSGDFHRQSPPVDFPAESGASTVWLTLR